MAARRIVWELVNGGECSAETRTISQRYPKLGVSYWKDEAAGWEAIDTRKAKAFQRFGSIVHPMSLLHSSRKTSSSSTDLKHSLARPL